MRRRWALGILWFGCFVLASGCTLIHVDTGVKCVAPEEVLRLSPGTTQEDILKAIGTLGRHQFSVVRDGHHVTLTVLNVAMKANDQEGDTCYLLLRDGKLWKVVNWIRGKRKLEVYPYMGTTATRPASWPITDESLIDAYVAAPPVGADMLRRQWENHRKSAVEAERKEEPMNILPAFLLSGFFSKGNLDRIQKDYETNRELLAKYDGHRIHLEDTVEAVERQLGKSRKTIDLSDGRQVRLYGEDMNLQVNPLYAYSWVAVVFQNAHATRVFSDGFLNKKWKEGNDIQAPNQALEAIGGPQPPQPQR